MRQHGSRRWKQEQRARGRLLSKRGAHFRDPIFIATNRKTNTHHGHATRAHKTPEYMAYLNAKKRCRDPRCTTYQHYGGRGIKFLYTDFEHFLRDVGPRPSSGLPRRRSLYSLDRINNNGHYEPGNCRWATQSAQVKKRRRTGLTGAGRTVHTTPV